LFEVLRVPASSPLLSDSNRLFSSTRVVPTLPRSTSSLCPHKVNVRATRRTGRLHDVGGPVPRGYREPHAELLRRRKSKCTDGFPPARAQTPSLRTASAEWAGVTSRHESASGHCATCRAQPVRLERSWTGVKASTSLSCGDSHCDNTLGARRPAVMGRLCNFCTVQRLIALATVPIIFALPTNRSFAPHQARRNAEATIRQALPAPRAVGSPFDIPRRGGTAQAAHQKRRCFPLIPSWPRAGCFPRLPV